ncbi:MAG: 2-phosphosulfolactate phosphatase [Microgenomates group bacterium]
MQIQKLFGVEQARDATGFVVVIDVFRAASTAACALAQGAKEIIPVATKEDAFLYRETHLDTLIMGEDKGIMIPGFDFGNSPYLLAKEDLIGKTMIHRSTQGTQGLVRAIHASPLVFGSFVIAQAIVSYIRAVAPLTVTFVALGGEQFEDGIFATYMEDLLQGRNPTKHSVEKQIQGSIHAKRFFDPMKPDFPKEDYYFCLDINKFPFVVEAVRTPYLHLVKKTI